MNVESRINHAVADLLRKERFYGEFLQGVTRITSNTLPAAAAVGFNTNTQRMELIVNPTYLDKAEVSHSELTAILKHEALHIIMFHLHRCKWTDLTNAQRIKYNIAMDCAINQYIVGLPEWTVSLDNFNKKNECDAKPFMPFEYYLQFIKDGEEGEGDGDGDGDGGEGAAIDSHELFGEGASEGMKEEIEKLIKEAANKVKQAGNLPSEIVEVIKAMQSIRSWKKELNKFTTKAVTSDIEDTRTRRNRRQRQDSPLLRGNRITTKRKIVFAIDTSGSMESKLLAQIAGELNRVKKESNAHILVVECDTKVNQVFELGSKPISELECKGRGGTLVKPVFDLITESFDDIDGLIYATDGGIFDGDDVLKPKYPVLWMLPTSQDCDSFKEIISWGARAAMG